MSERRPSLGGREHDERRGSSERGKPQQGGARNGCLHSCLRVALQNCRVSRSQKRHSLLPDRQTAKVQTPRVNTGDSDDYVPPGGREDLGGAQRRYCRCERETRRQNRTNTKKWVSIDTMLDAISGNGDSIFVTVTEKDSQTAETKNTTSSTHRASYTPYVIRHCIW